METEGQGGGVHRKCAEVITLYPCQCPKFSCKVITKMSGRTNHSIQFVWCFCRLCIMTRKKLAKLFRCYFLINLGSAIFVLMSFLAVSVYGHGLYTRTCKIGSREYRKSGGGN